MNTVDLETRLRTGHPQELRLWLRLLTLTQLIERDLRTHLREQFDTTLARFDLMAQLERVPEGLRMSDLSRRMMVTGGNVTSLTDQLVAEKLVERVAVPEDRRARRVRLTPEGRKHFSAMAIMHEDWIVESFGILDPSEMNTLHDILGKVKHRLLERSTLEIP